MMFLDLLPDGHVYCVAYGNRTPNRLAWVSQRSDLIPTAQNLEAQGFETWYAFAGFSDTSARNGENVAALQALIWDIDVDYDGKKGGYATIDEVVAAFVALVQSGSILEPSSIVASGGGLHVYWGLTAPIDGGAWHALEHRLRELAKALDPKLACDQSCFTKPAGLLRLPGTSNQKYNPPRHVTEAHTGPFYDLATVDAWLPQATNVVAFPSTVRRSAPASAPQSLLSFPRSQVDGDTVRANCRVFQHYASTPPLWESYSAWRSLVQLTAYMDDGERHAAEITQPYLDSRPTSKRRPHDKHADAVANADSGIGPIFCDNLRAECGLTVSDCAGCPLAGKVKATPIGLPSELALIAHTATKTYEPTDFEAAILDLVKTSHAYGNYEPKPPPFLMPGQSVFYVDTSTGAIMTSRLDENGVPCTVTVADIAFWPVRILHGENGEVRWQCCAHFVSKTSGRHHYHLFETSVEPLAKATDAVKHLRRYGVGIRLSNTRHLQLYLDYLVEWSRHESRTLVKSSGWTPKGSFVVGGIEIGADAKLTPIDVASDARAMISRGLVGHNGSLEAQLDILRIYEQHGSDTAKWLCMMAFAAPLFQMTGEVAAIVHLAGPSGLGKTSLQRWLTSQFGASVNTHLTVADTAKATDNILAGMNNHLVVLDEITALSRDQLKYFAYHITGGKSNAARSGNFSGDLRLDDRRWSSIVLTSANRSFHYALGETKGVEREAQHAQKMRVFEIAIDQPTIGQNATWNGENAIAAVNERLEANYGMLGIRYMQYVVSDHDEVKKRVRARFGQYAVHAASREQRYWFAVLACVVTAAEIATAFGWWNVSTFWVEKYGERLLGITKQTAIASQTKIAEIFADYVAANAAAFERHVSGRLIPADTRGAHQIAGADYGVNNGAVELAIVARLFDRHLEQSGTSPAAVMQSAAQAGILSVGPAGGFTTPTVFSVSPLAVPAYVVRLPLPASAAGTATAV